ncbi:MAG: hypothetical protein HQK51_05995 [Oligoflexia bacterium]|nr:hypothetical protein [Oligoflexia bacterium]
MKRKFYLVASIALSIFFMNSFYVSNVDAKVFTTKKSKDLLLSKESLKKIILDYENFCEHGCKYKLSDVIESKILESDKKHMYVWTHVGGEKEFGYFTYVEITEAVDGKITMKESYPSNSEVTRLRTKYELKHNPFFNAYTGIWTLKEKYTENRNFLATTTSYEGNFTYDSAFAIIFAARINKELNKTTEELFTALQQ